MLLTFTTFYFYVFLAVVAVLYFIIPLKYRWIELLVASISFYCIYGLLAGRGFSYLPFILTATIVSYLMALLISDSRSKLQEELKNTEDRKTKKILTNKYQNKCKYKMIFALVVVIAILAYTKFAGMVWDSFANIAAKYTDGTLSALDVIVPLGISYYTFSVIGYVLDVYWERYEAEKNPFKYFLFVIYFPHILQGPIARFDKLGPQLFEGHKYDHKRVAHGLQLMLWGIFQKLVIADRLSPFVATVYDDWNNQKGSVILLATLFYAVQIYMDFAGCVNMAHGMSQIFGIELEENFNQPYFSKSVAEFWRRWHMTLGAWFKDYLCIPVSVSGFVKNISKKFRKKWGKQAGKNSVTVSALIVVWICTGVWHGTGWNYVIWGIWQGGIIVISTLLEKKFVDMKKALRINDKSWWWQGYQIIRTFILTGIIPRVITRAVSVGAAARMLKRMIFQFDFSAVFSEKIFEYGMDKKNFLLAVIVIGILFLVSLAKEKGVHIRETIDKLPLPVRWAIYYMAVISIIIFGVYGPGYDASSFLYMKF